MIGVVEVARASARSSQDQGLCADARQGHPFPAPLAAVPPSPPASIPLSCPVRLGSAQIFATVCPPRPICRGQTVKQTLK
ncbi:unnamed protein product [Pieris macdunnoughi]|uniref:Uncharacterized protein n=1 Tax=Pieris macdunnoughi TaxID=345717 RepID=A0A821MQU3_9NEOP|nr:unnamed protein product [Pieris macdunnoughi]